MAGKSKATAPIVKMSKAELVERVKLNLENEGRQLSKAQCSDVVDAVYEGIAHALESNQAVTLPRIGTIRPVVTKPRTSKVPGHPERTVDVPAKKTYRFKVSSAI